MNIITKSIASILTTAVVLTTASAEVFPVMQDSAGSTVSNKIVRSAGAATTLPVNPKSSAYIHFGIASSGYAPAQVAQARLVIFFPSVTKAGSINVRLNTSAFQEVLTTSFIPSPSISAPFATIPLPLTMKKNFVIVDVTSQVKDFLSGTTPEFGFAITSDGTANCTVGSKEGAASGYPAYVELDITNGAGSVGATELADSAVTTVKINAGAVDNTKLASGAVTTQKLADDAVTTAKLSDTSVTTAKLSDGSVTTLKIAGQAIGTTQLAGGSVTGPKVADGAIDTAKLNNNAVTSEKIANDAVNTAQLADDSVTSGKIVNGAVGSLKIASGAVTASKLGSDVGLWSVNGADIVRSTGKVAIGAATPLARFHVATGTGQNLIVRPGSEIGSISGIGIQSVNDANTLNQPFTLTASEVVIRGGRVGIGRTAAANQLEVEGDASKTTATAWLANSDRRIKQDIQPIGHALETLDRVRLVDFRYTDAYLAQHPIIEDRRYLNVIAQEFATVFPGHVKPSGEKLEDGSAILQVDTYPLTIYSAAAIQELHRANKAKDAEIAALKQQLAENAERDNALAARLARLEDAAAQPAATVKATAPAGAPVIEIK